MSPLVMYMCMCCCHCHFNDRWRYLRLYTN